MDARRVTSGLYHLQNDRPMIDGPLPAMEASRQRIAKARRAKIVPDPIAIGVKAGKSSRTRAPRQSAERNTLKCLAGPDAPMKVEPISEEVIPWTKISCANWRNVSDRYTQDSVWGSRRTTRRKSSAKVSSSFT